MKTSHAVAGCLSLLLLVLLVWRLAGDGFKPDGLFGAADLAKSAPALDSFSEPSVGLAVVKQEAEQLMLAYAQSRDEAAAGRSGPVHDGAATAGQAAPGSGGGLPAGFSRAAAREASAVKLMAQLDAEVQDLGIDLDLKLLATYAQNNSCNEFLDCYLRLAQQVAALPWVAVWSPQALECARKCGRAEEVTDALRHVICFQPNLHCAEWISGVLQRWGAQHSQSPGIMKR
jgi:hypothetical protein